MHEFSICGNIVDAVVSEMGKRRPGSRLLTTRLVVGSLRQVVPDYLSFAYDVLTRNTIAEGSVLDIRSVPATARCVKCGNENGMTPEGLFECTACGAYVADVTAGNELRVESLEIDEPDTEKDGQ